jgi:hypothetical protein
MMVAQHSVNSQVLTQSGDSLLNSGAVAARSRPEQLQNSPYCGAICHTIYWHSKEARVCKMSSSFSKKKRVVVLLQAMEAYCGI